MNIVEKISPKKLINRYRKGDKRTKGVIRSASISVITKIANIIGSFIIVPLTINYVSPTKYGIWLTLSSVIAWITFFNMGLGHGFRNKFAKSKAENNTELAKQYVSTTYFTLGAIVFIVLSIALIINNYIDWSSFLNLPSLYNKELKYVFGIVCTFTCIKMVAHTFDIMLTADQHPEYEGIISAIGQYSCIVIIYILTKSTEGNLSYLALVYSGVPITILVVISIITFIFTKYRKYAPSIHSFRFSLIKDIMNKGIQFFAISLCMLAIFQIVNIIIQRELGSIAVTQYNIAHKLFSVIYMFMLIIINPLWSATTDAYIKQEFGWIKSLVKKMERIFMLATCCGVLILLLSPYIYQLWIGKDIEINFALSAAMLLLILSQTYGAIYMYIINGIGCIRIQLITYIMFATVCWSLYTYAGRMFGVIGITAIPAIVFLFQAIICRIQLNKILNKRATGIWIK